MAVFETDWKYSNSKFGSSVAESAAHVQTLVLESIFVFVEKVHAEIFSSRTEIIDTKAYYESPKIACCGRR